ncbi:uncharacterized protein RB166_010016 isoform 2-T4 [Leptodactylus fuscus]|uniref:uncharacterized protein LOC142202322 isoform X2 n=1 Tax=Leptodactylus fuscus TaxID=238119 RepID=UPI003F4E96C8
MGLTLQEVLLTALKKLDHLTYQRFILKLSIWKVREGYKNIPKDELMGKDPDHVAGLIHEYYSYAYGAEVTLAVLEDIGEKKVQEELQRDLWKVDNTRQGLGTSMFTEKVIFIDRHRSDLVKKVVNVDQVLRDLRGQDLLTQDQYKDVTAKTTTEEQMRRLCDIIRCWEDTGKSMAYNVLRKYNEDLIKDLQNKEWIQKITHSQNSTDRVNFIEDHRSDLIIWIMDIDPVLRDLRDQDLLTQDQYNDMMEKPTTREKMRELCDIIRYWEDTGKVTAYNSLRKHNQEVIKDLEMEEWKWGNSQPQLIREKINFIDDHRADLIKWLTNIDPVLGDLRDQDLLTQEQYNDVTEKETSREKMRELCDIIRDWGDTEKYTAYRVLRKHNEETVEDLDMEEWMKKTSDSRSFRDKVIFIDCHRSALIQRIKDVDPVLCDLRHLLTQEQYDHVMRKKTSLEKMRELCDIIRDWRDTEKSMAYRVLRKHNEEIIKYLEVEDWVRKNAQLQHFRGRVNFIDEHQSDLIRCITDVDPVLRDLRDQDLLTREQYKEVMAKRTSPEKMRELCDIIRYWEDLGKCAAYTILRRYNEKIITDMKVTQESKRRTIKHPLLSRAEQYYIYREEQKLMEGSIENLEIEDVSSKTEQHRTSQEPEMSQMCDVGMIEDDTSCKLCEKSQESVQVVTPSIFGTTYRLSMTSPGLFRCSDSGIQFQVTQPVTIEYEVDSWSNYTEILQNLRGGYEIIGPLFNVKSRLEPNMVSTVYLPHCLCVGGFKGDKSLIRCFHHKDDNLVLETPSRLEGKYAVLENPTFSCIGVILYPLSLLQEGIMRLIPYHGMVLLFCNTIVKKDLRHQYRLHLYLLPRIHLVEKEVERTEMKFSFQRIPKPPQTESVYYKKKYRINGPRTARVNPEILLFESHCPSEIYSFIEISIEGETSTEVNVSILPENEDVTVWKSVVSAGHRNPLAEEKVHFVDEHRAVLIRMIFDVDLVLDDLLDQRLLNNEQYDTVLSKNTNAEKMRMLYSYIRSWGYDDKDKVYQSLWKHNQPLMKKLDREDYNDTHKVNDRNSCQIL